MVWLTKKGDNIHSSALPLSHIHPSIGGESKQSAKTFWCAIITKPITFSDLANPSRFLWTLSPWKSQLHLISTETPVIYQTEKHCSAGPSIQPEIQCAERKENLHGEKQRQNQKLSKDS